MTRNEVYPSRWLKAADLSPDGEQVTIRKVTVEEIGEEREKKPIISFDDHRQRVGRERDQLGQHRRADWRTRFR